MRFSPFFRASRYLAAAMLLIAALALLMAACSGKPSPKKEEMEKIVLADTGWESIRLHNAIVGTIAEVCYNCTWKQKSVTVDDMFSGLQKGEIDVCTELWSKNISGYDDALKDRKFKELGLNYDDNVQGFYVPAYMVKGDPQRNIPPRTPDLKSVKDLARYAEVFTDPKDHTKGRIYGAVTGWGIDAILSKKIKAYGLDEKYNYINPNSEVALTTSIVAAVEKGEPWVGYYWTPTYLPKKIELICLADEPYSETLFAEGRCEIPPCPVMIGVSNKFAEKKPEFIDFLKNYRTSGSMTTEGLVYIHENGSSYDTAARWLIKTNKEMFLSWLPEDKRPALIDAIYSWK